MPAGPALGPVALSLEGRPDLAQRGAGGLELAGPGDRRLLALVGDQGAAAGAVAERRRPKGKATTGGLGAAATAQPQGDHGPLILRHRAQHLADQPPRGILGIVMEVRLPTGGREQLPGPPDLGQQLLLEDQVAGEPVEPVDDDRAGPTVLDRSQGLGQPEPVLELLVPDTPSSRNTARTW